MLLGDVVDQLHDENGLADAGAAEEADLAASGVRSQEVDDLDPGGECLDLGGLVHERRSFTVDAVLFLVADRAHLVNRLADDVQDAAQGLLADRDRDLLAHVEDLLATNQTVGGVHRDGSDCVLAEVLGNFQDQVELLVVDRRVGDPKSVVNRGEHARLEFDVDNRADDLRYFSEVLTHVTSSSCGLCRPLCLYS